MFHTNIKFVNYSLHICLDELWESKSFGIQYLTYFINGLIVKRNILNGLNPGMCLFQLTDHIR